MSLWKVKDKIYIKKLTNKFLPGKLAPAYRLINDKYRKILITKNDPSLLKKELCT